MKQKVRDRNWAYKPNVKPRIEDRGWLNIWWLGNMPGDHSPARRVYCTKRQVASIVREWQAICPLQLMKHEWVSDTPRVLDIILKPEKTPLQAILEG